MNISVNAVCPSHSEYKTTMHLNAEPGYLKGSIRTYKVFIFRSLVQITGSEVHFLVEECE